MPKFKYVATDSQGNERTGTIEALSKGNAGSKLKDMGFFPSSITEAAAPSSKKQGFAQANANVPKKKKPLFGVRVKRKLLMSFTRQLATLIDAGVPLLRALQIMHKQEKHAGLKIILGSMCDSIETGSQFADALAEFPKVFDRLFVNMVKVGEAGGSLHTTLNSLAEFIEKSENIKTKVRGAMIYPIVVLLMAVGILTFLMIGIIPRFTEIFEGLLEGQQLPAITRFVIAISNTIMHRAPLVIGVVVAIVVGIKLLAKVPAGALALDYMKLKAPVFGRLLTMVSVSRFSRTLSTLMNSGVPILQALKMVKNTVDNNVVAREIQHVHDSVKEGESFSAPLENSKVFPPMVVSMIAVGDETGRVPDMLGKIADNYDAEVDSVVEGITSIIEPVLIIFLAVIVGTIVIAMFMPLIKLMGNLT